MPWVMLPTGARRRRAGVRRAGRGWSQLAWLADAALLALLAAFTAWLGWRIL
jgi:hypothetical protein